MILHTVVMNNKIAIFSDLHLGVHQNSTYWLDQSVNWVKWFVEDLQKKKIKTIIFCGDFFHYRDEVSLLTLNYAQQILEMLKEFEIYMIAGNHDCYYKDTSEVNSLSLFKGWNNIKVFDKYFIEKREHYFNKKVISFCPWGTKLCDIEKSDVVFGHFELQNFKMNAHKICDDGENPALLSEKAPLIITGHFHLRDEKIIGNSMIVYIGNPFQMDFGDVHQRKGYYTLDTMTLEYEFIENSLTPKHIIMYLSRLIKLKEIETTFNSILPGNIIKLIIDKNISSDHLDTLVSKMTSYRPTDFQVDYDINYSKIKVKGDNDIDLSGVDINQAIIEFVEMLDINNKKEVVDYTISLYNKAKL